MTKIDKNTKQIYDATLTMISNLHLKKNVISREEMYCLLSILDMVVHDKKEDDFLDLLRAWQNGPKNEEIDAIIKATLLQTDFKDPLSIQQNQAIIEDLLAYKRNQKLN